MRIERSVARLHLVHCALVRVQVRSTPLESSEVCVAIREDDDGLVVRAALPKPLDLRRNLPVVGVARRPNARAEAEALTVDATLRADAPLAKLIGHVAEGAAVDSPKTSNAYLKDARVDHVGADDDAEAVRGGDPQLQLERSMNKGQIDPPWR